jgi:parallel beta-helix repeat protein
MQLPKAMQLPKRVVVAVALLLALVAGIVLLRRFGGERAPVAAADTSARAAIEVTSDGDRGPGSLREALFSADTAPGAINIIVRVKNIALQTPLPPVVNPHGLSIVATDQGTLIDAHALASGSVFDINGANASIIGITIHDCPAAGILVRSSGFHLRAAVIEACDVGVEVAENAVDLTLEHNRFVNNRVGVRFAASNRNALLSENEFSADKDAGVWAVRGEPDIRDSDGITVRDNKFADDRMGVIAGNISILLERNELRDTKEAALQLIGAGAVARGNRISGGAAAGIVVEGARGVVIENNELDHITAYGILVRASASTLIQGNRISNSGYGMGFVLGDVRDPSTAVDNAILSQKFHGIDVIGDSPVLRRNRVIQSEALALHVEDFQPPNGVKVVAHPFLEGNSWSGAVEKSVPVAAGNGAARAAGSAQ